MATKRFTILKNDQLDRPDELQVRTHLVIVAV